MNQASVCRSARRGGAVGVMRLALVAGILSALVGCTGSIHDSKDFERHRYSQLVEPRDRSDVVYVDVKVDVNYPDGSAGAEAVRMEWIAAWLEARKMCAEGFEIEQRRAFETMENNPGQYDIRYEVSCLLPLDAEAEDAEVPES